MPQESGEIAKGNIAPFGKYAAAGGVASRAKRATEGRRYSIFMRAHVRVIETNPSEKLSRNVETGSGAERSETRQ